MDAFSSLESRSWERLNSNALSGIPPRFGAASGVVFPFLGLVYLEENFLIEADWGRCYGRR